MRRLSILIGALLLATAGCGGDDGGEAAGPLDAALGYLPEDAPLVVAIETDVDGDQFKALESIVDKFPLGGQLRDQLLQELEVGGDFEEDIEPILGNEFVVGATDAASIIDDSEDDNFVAAIEAGDKEALENAVEKEGAERHGREEGRHPLRGQRRRHVRDRRRRSRGRRLARAARRGLGATRRRRPADRGHLRGGPGGAFRGRAREGLRRHRCADRERSRDRAGAQGRMGRGA